VIIEQTGVEQRTSCRVNEPNWGMRFLFIDSYGCGGGVGRSLGVGAILGVGVAGGVGEDVAVAVAVGVAVGVAVVIGVGPGIIPPHTIISTPVQTAVCWDRAAGALTMLVLVQLFAAGLYLPPVLKEPSY